MEGDAVAPSWAERLRPLRAIDKETSCVRYAIAMALIDTAMRNLHRKKRLSRRTLEKKIRRRSPERSSGND